MSPKVSVIVCHHTGNLLFGFLESIFKSTDVSFEVIVMTSNKELAIKGIKNCIVIHHEGLPAEKRNAGSRIAKGEFLAFFDDDVEVDTLCLYHLLEGFGQSIGMVYGKLLNMEHRNRFDEAGSFLTITGFLYSRAGQHIIDKGQFNKDAYVLSGKSASCMIKAKLFKDLGGFDESFGILGEETDLAWRVWLMGRSVLYCPQSVAYHAFNTKFKPVQKFYTSDRVHYNGCRNYITMLMKNLGEEHLWIIKVHSLIWTFAAFAMIGTGKTAEGKNILRGLKYVRENREAILRKREEIQNKRVKSDKDIWPSIFCRPPRGYYVQRFTRYISSGLHG